MKVAIFDIHEFERAIFDTANAGIHDLKYINARLTPETVEAARGSSVVCCFAHDQVDRNAIHKFSEMGIKLIALRSAGFNHVNLEAAKECGLQVVRVPDYSPYAIAEHAVALLLSLNRKVHRAFNRVRELNFSLEGLVGFDLHGKTVGVIGAGRIGQVFCQIMKGFGCKLIVYDIIRNPELETFVNYETLEELFARSDVISLHVPLTPHTYHLINERAFELMKPNSILINTGRGGLIDSKALIKALKLRKISGACLDVYEEEENIFFQDLSRSGIDDDVLARLLTFPNVLITAHQGFLTTEAITNIAETTLSNISAFEAGKDLKFRLE